MEYYFFNKIGVSSLNCAEIGRVFLQIHIHINLILMINGLSMEAFPSLHLYHVGLGEATMRPKSLSAKAI